MSRRVLRSRNKELPKANSNDSEDNNLVGLSSSGRLTRSKLRENLASAVGKPRPNADSKKNASKKTGTHTKSSKKQAEKEILPHSITLVENTPTSDVQAEIGSIVIPATEVEEDYYSEVVGISSDIITSTPIADRSMLNKCNEGSISPFANTDLEISESLDLQSTPEKPKDNEQASFTKESGYESIHAAVAGSQVNLECVESDDTFCADDSEDPFGFTKAEKRIRTFKKTYPSETKSSSHMPTRVANTTGQSTHSEDAQIQSEPNSAEPGYSDSGELNTESLEVHQSRNQLNEAISDNEETEAHTSGAQLDSEQHNKKRHSGPVVEIYVKNPDESEQEKSPKKRRGKGKLQSYSGRKESKERLQGDGLSFLNKEVKSKVDNDMDSVMAEHLKHFIEIDNFELAEEYVY